ncbi:hypothetical protein [Mesorhizobium sp.]|uniref:hypothetical protein n=1 Tax=Mesorhizobium sp. TaxID=1871066 RepID=UPI0025E88224|nr:hypothetical protein [Mesorhizobium sp.]
MKHFWEESPLWQRKEELLAELKKAAAAMDKAGREVLTSLQMGFLDSLGGREDRAAYLTAHEAWQDAYVAWSDAHNAYRASPAGQAERRYFARLRADRIARESVPVTEVA